MRGPNLDSPAWAIPNNVCSTVLGSMVLVVFRRRAVLDPSISVPFCRSPVSTGLDCARQEVLGFSVSGNFRWEAAVDPRGGGHETAKPNHWKMSMWLGFVNVCLPTGVPKLGSGLSILGFASFAPKLRSLTSSHISDLVRLLENRAQSAKPSLGTAKPRPFLPGLGGLILGLDVTILGFNVLRLFRRSPADPIAGLLRFSALSPKPNTVKPNAPQPGSRFSIDQKSSISSPYIYDK